MVANLRAQVVNNDFNRTDIGFHHGNTFFNSIVIDGIKEISSRRTTFLFVAAAAQDSMITFATGDEPSTGYLDTP